MNRFWFAFSVVVFHLLCFLIFPQWGMLGIASLLFCGVVDVWWRVVIKKTLAARPAVIGFTVMVLLMPPFIQIFEVEWVRIALLILTMAVSVIYQYYVVSLVGHIRARSPLLTELLTSAHAITLGMVGVIVSSVALSMVQYVMWWVIGFSLFYGIVTAEYYRGLKVGTPLILPSILLQVILVFEVWWVIMLLPFAPLTKTLMGLLPLLTLTYIERDRMLLLIDQKQLQRTLITLVLTLTLLIVVTRWS